MRKGKDYVFDFNDPVAVKKFRETVLKMFSIMRKARSVKIEKLHIGTVSAEKHTLKNIKIPDPMIMLHLHGGGYFTGSAEMYRAFISSLCKRLQVHAYSINYRLVPEYPYPAALDDAFTAYKWLIEERSIPAEKIIVLGDSAGGGLALALLHRIGKNCLTQPKCAICLSPWTDLTLSNDSYINNRENDSFFNFINLENAARLYIGKDSAENPEISPVFADFSSFPPIFLQVGSTEMLLNDSTVIAEKLRKQGISVTIDVWEGLFHDFPIFSRMPVIGRLTPEFKQAINNMKLFIDSL
jgi:monoterpene epsilon-lactone hydrolase